MVEGDIPGKEKFHILRIALGETIVATQKINNDEAPPLGSVGLYEVHNVGSSAQSVIKCQSSYATIMMKLNL